MILPVHLTIPVVVGLAVLLVAAGVAPALISSARAPGPPGPRRRPGAGWRARHGWPRRADAPDELAVAAWCERVAGGLRGGSSLTRSVVDAGGEPGSPFPDVVLAVGRGQPLGAAFRDGPSDPTTAAGLAGPVVATCAELGGPSASALERVAAVLLARAAEREERRTASAQARMSAQVLTVVPFGVVALLVVTEPSIRQALVTPAGAACLVVGGALDGAGWWWMRRMIGASS